MRLGGHIRQFGNDFFLLRKIECHCFTFRTGSHCASCACAIRISTDSIRQNPLASCDAELVAVQKILSGFTICAGCLPNRLRSRTARFLLHASRVLPCHSTRPPAVFDGSAFIAEKRMPSNLLLVIPAKAGIQRLGSFTAPAKTLDPGFRRDDKNFYNASED
ncbi:MAG: hypothetical protein JSS33_07235 [Proteobacteria bacterium]|nr:hypothetical protein [Pseudomonadota bacterium]